MYEYISRVELPENNFRDITTLKMNSYYVVALCVLLTVSALPTPDELHTDLQDPLFPSEDLSQLAVNFLRKQPHLEIHNIKIKCSKNKLSKSQPEICSDLVQNDFDDSNVIKKDDEDKLKQVKNYLKEFKAEEPEDPEKTTDSSPSGEKQEEKNSEEIEESVTDEKETTTKKPDSGEKESGENISDNNNSEEKEIFEPEVLPPEDNKKPSILSIFSPIFHFFDNIVSYWKPKSKFDTQRSFYIIEIESDNAV